MKSNEITESSEVNEIKLNQMKSNEIKWNQTKSSEITWNQLKSSETTWNQMKSRVDEWNQMKSSETKWNQLKSCVPKWNQQKLSETKCNAPHPWATMSQPPSQPTHAPGTKYSCWENPPSLWHVVMPGLCRPHVGDTWWTQIVQRFVLISRV